MFQIGRFSYEWIEDLEGLPESRWDLWEGGSVWGQTVGEGGGIFVDKLKNIFST